MARLGYARVSTADQHADAQARALEAEGIERVFIDEGVSGTTAPHDRPAMGELLTYAREGDSIVVWRLDRVGRNAASALAFMDDLRQRGIGLRLLSEGIDTAGSTGRLISTILLAVAQAEREVLLERQALGIAAARARGVRLGRPRALTTDQVALALRLRDEGRTFTQIGFALGVSRASAYRATRQKAGPQD